MCWSPALTGWAILAWSAEPVRVPPDPLAGGDRLRDIVERAAARAVRRGLRVRVDELPRVAVADEHTRARAPLERAGEGLDPRRLGAGSAR